MPKPKSCLGKGKRSGKSKKHGLYRYRCSASKCHNFAVTLGVCHRHGAPRTTCKYTDGSGCRCKKFPKKNGMCKSHHYLTKWKEWFCGDKKLNTINASTIEIPSDNCGSDDDEMTFESGTMINDTDNNETADTTCACPRRSARIKAKLNKMGDECTMVGSLYPEPDSKFPKIDLDDFGKSMHNLPFCFGMNNKHPNRLTNIGLFANHRFFQSAKSNISWNQLRPLPPLPFLLASGKPVLTKCFNPFNHSAPDGFWREKKKEVEQCAAALLGLEKPKPFLFIHCDSISKDIVIDEILKSRNLIGFCIHTDVDVELCGLSREASRIAFKNTVRRRNATDVIEEAKKMIPIIKGIAKKQSKTFTIQDDYTTRFGYSVNQMRAMPANGSKNFLLDSIARGGPAQQHFRKRSIADKNNIIST